MRCLAPAICLLLVACTVTPPTPTATPNAAPTAPAIPTASAAAPVTAPPVGELDENGIPRTLSGVPVHRGDDLTAAIAASTDTTPFLAGGWFHADAGTRYCSFYSGDFAVAGCPGIQLFRDRVGGKLQFFGPGDVPGGAFAIAFAATRPVVVEAHTHDPRCQATDTDCPNRPILSAVAWLGEAPTDSPPPRPLSSAPPGGLTRDAAVTIAKHLADRHNGAITVRWAVAGPHWAVPHLGLKINDETWVWAIYLEADFPRSAESEFIAIDYLSGDLVEGMTPAGPGLEPDVPGVGP